MTTLCRVLLITGSLRRQSTNTALLRAAQDLAPPGTDTTLYRDLGDLPHFNPDDDGPELPEAAAGLRAAIRSADALVFSTPEYAGALPGSFKNLLDWSIGDGEAGSIYEKPVCWLNASPRGANDAHASLRTVLSYAHATIVEAACVTVPIRSGELEAGAIVLDQQRATQVREALELLVAKVAH